MSITKIINLALCILLIYLCFEMLKKGFDFPDSPSYGFVYIYIIGNMIKFDILVIIIKNSFSSFIKYIFSKLTGLLIGISSIGFLLSRLLPFDYNQISLIQQKYSLVPLNTLKVITDIDLLFNLGVSIPFTLPILGAFIPLALCWAYHYSVENIIPSFLTQLRYYHFAFWILIFQLILTIKPISPSYVSLVIAILFSISHIVILFISINQKKPTLI